jgi:hypothetical protein
MLPININNMKPDLIRFLGHDMQELFLEGGPTYVHCAEGKDRTGFAVALVQCKYLGKDPEEAIEEAKSLGFGANVPQKPIHLFEKIIRNCKPEKDTNSADIVSNEREYISDNRDSFLDEGRQSSFAPFQQTTRQLPQDALYNFVMEPAPGTTRENYHHGKPIKEHDSEADEIPEGVPMVGVYDNDAGGRGFGPVEPNPGGFIYD